MHCHNFINLLKLDFLSCDVRILYSNSEDSSYDNLSNFNNLDRESLDAHRLDHLVKYDLSFCLHDGRGVRVTLERQKLIAVSHNYLVYAVIEVEEVVLNLQEIKILAHGQVEDLLVRVSPLDRQVCFVVGLIVLLYI